MNKKLIFCLSIPLLLAGCSTGGGDSGTSTPGGQSIIPSKESPSTAHVHHEDSGDWHGSNGTHYHVCDECQGQFDIGSCSFDAWKLDGPSLNPSTDAYWDWSGIGYIKVCSVCERPYTTTGSYDLDSLVIDKLGSEITGEEKATFLENIEYGLDSSNFVKVDIDSSTSDEDFKTLYNVDGSWVNIDGFTPSLDLYTKWFSFDWKDRIQGMHVYHFDSELPDYNMWVAIELPTDPAELEAFETWRTTANYDEYSPRNYIVFDNNFRLWHVNFIEEEVRKVTYKFVEECEEEIPEKVLKGQGKQFVLGMLNSFDSVEYFDMDVGEDWRTGDSDTLKYVAFDYAYLASEHKYIRNNEGVVKSVVHDYQNDTLSDVVTEEYSELSDAVPYLEETINFVKEHIDDFNNVNYSLDFDETFTQVYGKAEGQLEYLDGDIAYSIYISWGCFYRDLYNPYFKIDIYRRDLSTASYWNAATTNYHFTKDRCTYSEIDKNGNSNKEAFDGTSTINPYTSSQYTYREVYDLLG